MFVFLLLYCVYEIRGDEPTARKAVTTCKSRPKEKCCDSEQAGCFGCNVYLLANGISCDKQPKRDHGDDKEYSFPIRDCFCDTSCITFNDCCSDHRETCAHLYPSRGDATEKESAPDDTTEMMETASGELFNPKCSPDAFLNKVTNSGDPQYELQAEWQRKMIDSKPYEVYTVHCVHKNLPPFSFEFPVKSKRSSVRNYCKKPKSVQCGDKQTNNSVENEDGDCLCSADDIAARFMNINTAMTPFPINAKCKKLTIKPKKEKWEIFCNGESHRVVKTINCKIKNKIHCGEDGRTCGLSAREVLDVVNFGTKEDGYSEGFKEGFTSGFTYNATRATTLEEKEKVYHGPSATCEAATTKFDTWSIFCDDDKNGKWDKGEKRKTFKFRATQKKAQQAHMKLTCHKEPKDKDG